MRYLLEPIARQAPRAERPARARPWTGGRRVRRRPPRPKAGRAPLRRGAAQPPRRRASGPVILEVAPNDDYALIDSGDGQKLEQYGPYRIVRPEGQAIWQRALPEADWNRADAVFTGDTDEEGMGRWRFPKRAARRDLADEA